MSKRRAYDTDDDYRSRKRTRANSETQEIEDRLESLILRVGEKSTSSLESNLEGLSGVLEADLNNYKGKILKILVECASTMPRKCSIYSTLVGMLNAKNYNFGGEFVELMVRSYKDSLKNCNWDKARYTLRFLSDLVNCRVISAGSLMDLYMAMMDVAAEERVPQVRTDWYAYAVLSSLPWVGSELYDKKEDELDKLLTMLDRYIQHRQKIHHPTLRVWMSDEPHPQEEYLDCLWNQIKKLHQDMWQEKHIQRPYLAFDKILSEALQHHIPNIIPPPHHEDYQYPMPWVVFRMFDYTDCPEGPTLPGAHSVERYLIEEELEQIIDEHHVERKDTAVHLLSYPMKHKIPLEYMIVEVMFNGLMRLPTPQYIEIFYGSVLIELCKLQPSTIPQVLAQATELFYDRINTMNTTCYDRFVNWFSYNLSNFEFRWSWNDWVESLEEDPEHPKPKFIRECLAKCLRLSYPQRIVDMVPENFSVFLPPAPEAVCKYTREDAGTLPGAMVAHQLLTKMKQKCTPEDVLMVLRDLPTTNTDDEGSLQMSYNPLKIDVFVQTVLFLASKSISHSFAALAKFHLVFKILAESEEAQIYVLRNMFEVWHQCPQMMCILVDRMLKTVIVECSAVANWIFSKEMSNDFTKNYIWEILHLTIRKMNKHVAKLENELNDAREKLHHMDSDSSDSESENPDKDHPTEEAVEKMEEKLEAAQADQKNLFLIIFQRFIMILSEHLVRCDTDAKNPYTHWYNYTIGRLRGVFMAHDEQVHKYSQTLETLLFTQDLDHHILDVFQQFCALRT